MEKINGQGVPAEKKEGGEKGFGATSGFGPGDFTGESKARQDDAEPGEDRVIIE